MAMKDGAILAQYLKAVVDFDTDLLSAVAKYEKIRRLRVERIAKIAKFDGSLWTLPDGLEQSKRDEIFKTTTEMQKNLNREHN